jgi:single-strand DNA-binding protein
MNDTITIRGIVATAPRHLVTGTGLSITSFRLASPSRRWDRATSAWTNGDTNWFTVTAFRTLATNVQESIVKGDRVIVTGRLRVRPWERENRSGISVEIDGDGIGHDLAFGRSQWRKVPRHTADETSGPGEHPSDVDRAAAQHAADAAAAGADPTTGEIASEPEPEPEPDPDPADAGRDDTAAGHVADDDIDGIGLEARLATVTSAAVRPAAGGHPGRDHDPGLGDDADSGDDAGSVF